MKALFVSLPSVCFLMRKCSPSVSVTEVFSPTSFHYLFVCKDWRLNRIHEPAPENYLPGISCLRLRASLVVEMISIFCPDTEKKFWNLWPRKCLWQAASNTASSLLCGRFDPIYPHQLMFHTSLMFIHNVDSISAVLCSSTSIDISQVFDIH